MLALTCYVDRAPCQHRVLLAEPGLCEDPVVDYFKRDHNHDLVEAGGNEGRAAVHTTTNAVYRLMNTVKERHPGLEIEICASGSARVDLDNLGRTDRIWIGNCTVPLERLTIQKYNNFLVPNELMGARVGPA
ncbi:alpha-galactosidase C precursor [Pseudozyma hubeiensis SY62]|uniref:alpha-galactosidase n=1 Tax=Pseudozyma hubeiensis (strain SY62) TaxID=1305764 RepID=R9NW66_PSEHS|nr:alpha-galactosidase C precursor [Pseudozyma hubeiensis SY62]GAC92744.1 alpha-galactosidase C precursor [Pseudozyma hubeiensis SY62]